MRLSVALFAICLLSSLQPQLMAQEVELQTFTTQQRWDRAARHVALGPVSGMAYAKSMGQSVEDYANAMADLFVPGWGEAGVGRLSVVRSLYLNFASYPNCEFEIVDQSDTAITVRRNRPWSVFFGDDYLWYGVTIQEFETWYEIFDIRLAEHLGMGVEEWDQDGWRYIKFTLGG